MLENIFERVDKGIPLSHEDAVELLSIKNFSHEYYELLDKAQSLSQKVYQGKGYIFAQIGLDIAPCCGNCKFCSLAQNNTTFTDHIEKTEDEIMAEVSAIDFTKVTAVFLMTTANYNPEKFLEIGAKVKSVIPKDIALVANIFDFDLSYANKLKEAGFTGAYHIVRLREGVDTDISPELRIATLDAIKEAGLRLYYCLEPIGPEHTYDEMAVEMIRARNYNVEVMAVMRRVSVPGTAYEGTAMVDDFEMAKIVAVTRLVSMPKVSMNIHEPIMSAMMAGVNQLYAELGANPRDCSEKTENGRGYSVEEVSKILISAGYPPCIEKR